MDVGSTRAGKGTKTAALTLLVASLLSVVLMAFHPRVHYGTTAAALAAFAEQAWINAIVHGGLIALMGALLFAFGGLMDQFDRCRPRVRIGAVAYSIGAATMVGAAVVNGFIVPTLAAHYADRPAAELDSLRHLLTLCWAANQSLARIGAVATSAAIVAWSLELTRRAPTPRRVGVAGLLIGAVTIAGIVSGHLQLNVHGMGAVVVGQTIWNVAMAVLWLRGRV